MTILVMGRSVDAHAVHMKMALEQAGADVALLDTSTFPMHTRISWLPETAEGILTLPDGRDIKFSDIQSVYWRNICKTELPELDREARFLAMRDCSSTLRSFLNGTKARWVNSWFNYDDHKEKPLQLAKASAIGLTIPKTLISNNAQEVIDFVGTLNKAIYKPVYGGAHTDYVTPAMLQKDRLEKVLSIAPVTIQEFIAGTNIRTYVIDDQVFTAEIASGSVDFREDVDAKLIPMELPPEVHKQSLAIKKELNLQWTAIDWRRDENGVYHFLEANPSPMFINFELKADYPITNSLVSLLMK